MTRKEVEAYVWKRNGDHPHDDCHMIRPTQYGIKFLPFLSDGKVVKRFKPGDVKARNKKCDECGFIIQEHGYIQTPDNREFMVCPGDMIVTESPGVYVPVKPDEFEELFICKGDVGAKETNTYEFPKP